MSENLRDQVAAAYEASLGDEPVVAEEVSESTNATDASDESVGEAPSQDAPQEEPDDITPPDNWSQEDRESFQELDAKAKKLYFKRYKEMEAGYTKKSQSLSEERKIAESFKKAISRHEDHLKRLGVDPIVAVDKLLETERLFRVGTPGQKAQALQQLIRDYQIQVNQEAANIPPAIPLDPNLQALYEEQIRQRQYLDRLEQEKADREIQGVESQISSFSSTKDEKGELKYPHFEAVREKMGALINAGLAKGLEDSYEQAVLLNEDLRKDHISRQYNARQREEEAKQKVAASKRAGFNVKAGSGGDITEQIKSLPLRQQIAQAIEAQNKRARF